MDQYHYLNKEAECSLAEPLLAPGSYEMTPSRPRKIWQIVPWVLHVAGFLVVSLLSINLATKANNSTDLACLQLQSPWCKLDPMPIQTTF